MRFPTKSMDSWDSRGWTENVLCAILVGENAVLMAKLLLVPMVRITARIIWQWVLCMCAPVSAQSSWHWVLLNFGRCHSLNTRTTINFFFTFSFTSHYFVVCVAMFNTVFLQHNCDLIAPPTQFQAHSRAFMRLLRGFIFCTVWCGHFSLQFTQIYLFLLLFSSSILIVIGADCMASCRHSDHIDDTTARNHQKSSNGRHTRRETRLAIENTRRQRIGQRMVHGKLSHHFWHFSL